MQQGWIITDPSRMLKRRKPRPDRARALSRPELEQLLTREDMSVPERTFWRMLYETAARSAEVLALDVEDLDLSSRRARVRRKGGAIDIIIWQTGTARPGSCRGFSRAERPARYSLPSGRRGSSCPRPTLTRAGGPGSATSRPPRCFPRPLAVRPCSTSGTPRLPTTLRKALGRRC